MSNLKALNEQSKRVDHLPSSFISATPNNKPQQEHFQVPEAKYRAEVDIASIERRTLKQKTNSPCQLPFLCTGEEEWTNLYKKYIQSDS
jgi:hypothetical protein